jgi:2-iminobutanoate/2-iminopropanoate deaminase
LKPAFLPEVWGDKTNVCLNSGEGLLMQREVIWSDKGPKSIAPYSHAVKVGSLVFTSGLTAMAPGSSDILPEHQNNVEGQTRQTLENLKAV